MSASNARLLYNFDKLCGLTKYQNNYAGSKNPNGIRLASYVDLAYNRFTEIIKSNVHNSNIDKPLKYLQPLISYKLLGKLLVIKKHYSIL